MTAIFVLFFNLNFFKSRKIPVLINPWLIKVKLMFVDSKMQIQSLNL